ncbi:MAG: sortase [Candidatus Saccharimonadales bacterium]|jgi:LPXTG-site transpeptidase (sortase) family protein
MKLYKKLQITSFVVVAAGMLLLAPLSYLWLHEKIALATPPTVYVPAKAPLPADQPGMVSGTPDEIKILSLHMDLPVINGYYNAQNGQWTLTLNKAQYATPSVPPNNESGNTLIYGHYRTEVFAYLHLIKPGAEADVITNNGLTFKYTFQSSQPFDPTDTSIFLYQGAPRLTIQTCSGSLFQHRQMYYFKYDGYVKKS